MEDEDYRMPFLGLLLYILSSRFHWAINYFISYLIYKIANTKDFFENKLTITSLKQTNVLFTGSQSDRSILKELFQSLNNMDYETMGRSFEHH